MTTTIKQSAPASTNTPTHRWPARGPLSRFRPGSTLGGRLAVGLALAVLVYFLVWPLVMLAIGSFRTTPLTDNADWTLGGYTRAFTDPLTYLRLRNSLIYSATTACVSLSLATYFATIAARFESSLRRFITPTMILLAVTPRLFFSLAWGMLGSPSAGLLARLSDLLGLGISLDVYNWVGLLFVSCVKMTGYAYVLLLGPISGLDRSLEDAAVMSGSSRTRAYFGVALPLLAPAFFAIGILTVVLGLQVFDIPAIIGKPAGIMTLSLHVNDYLVGSIRPDYAAATALSLIFVAVIALMLLGQRRILAERDFSTITGKTSAQSQTRPSVPARLAINLSIVLFFLVAVAGPLIQIVMGSFQSYFGVYGSWTMGHYADVLGNPADVHAILVTLAIAVLGGLVTTGAAFGMTYAKQRAGSRIVRSVVSLGSWTPLLAPGIVLSVALLWSYLTTPLIKDLFGGPWLLLFALSVASIPIAVRALEGVIAQVAVTLEDAARMSGSGMLRTVVDVTASISRRSLLGAWLLVGLVMAGLLDVPLLLTGTNNNTVSTAAYAMYWDGDVAGAAALYCAFMLSILIVIAAGLATAILLRRAAGKRVTRDLETLSQVGATTHEGKDQS